MIIISIEKGTNDMVVNDITCTFVHMPKCYYMCGHAIFMAQCHPLNKTNVICKVFLMVYSKFIDLFIDFLSFFPLTADPH